MSADADALQRARILLGARRYSDAVAVASACAASRPGDPDPLIVVAWGEIGLRHFEEAERAALSAVALAPDMAEAHRVLVGVLTSRAYAQPHQGGGRLAGRRAVKAANELLRLAPSSVSSYWSMVDACASAHDARGAVAASETAIQMAPQSAQSWLLRARAARVAQDYPVAEAAAREALRLQPDNYLANNELGLILGRQGRTAEAIQQFASTASIDPIARPARTNLLRYGAGTLQLLIMVLTAPILIVVHQPGVWILVSVGINVALWRIPPIKRWLERTALAISLRRGKSPPGRFVRQGPSVPGQSLSRVHSVRPDTPIQSYRSGRTVLVLSLLLATLMSVVVTGAAAQDAPVLLPACLLIDIPTCVLAWFVFKRIRPRPMGRP